MKALYSILQWPVLALCLSGLFIQQSFAVDVRSTHPVYDFLERCELQDLTNEPLSNSRPYSQITVVSILLQIHEKRNELSRVETKLLFRYLYELSGTIERLHAEGDIPTNDFEPQWGSISKWRPVKRIGLFQNKKDAVNYKGNQWAVYANFTASAENYSRSLGNSDESFTVRSYGLDTWVWYKNVDFAGWTTENQISGDETYIDLDRFPYQFGEAEADNFDFYESEQSASYQDDHFLIYFGKGENSWGPSSESSLTLSTKGIPYTHLRLKGKFGPIEMTIVHGDLIAEPQIITHTDTSRFGRIRKIYAEKHFAAHRVQWNISQKFQIGLFEEVFYGKRNIDWEYLPPIIFFRGAEHYLHSTDNMQVGWNLRFVPLKGISLYLEILFDELMFDKLGTDYFTNKQGLLLNGKWVNPFGFKNSLLFADYIAVRPYVYAHKNPENVADHYGITLADPGVPNSEKISLGLKKDITASLNCAITAVHFRHGANPVDGTNVGGDHLIPQEFEGLKYAPFLNGDLNTWNRLEAVLDWEVIYNLRLQMTGIWIQHSVDYMADGTDFEDDGIEWQIGLFWHPVR
jgi:hypothetical protein